ncbi:MAG TPA: amidase [Candidatus Eisenbacteria bacterium]|nr:amidase [Candidatus Eisenbacteria bacterium]
MIEGVETATTAADAARRFRDGSLTPRELTEELLKRIDRENPKLNAYYEVFAVEARESATVATREIKEGRDRGPLHGVPVAIKDLFDVARHVTTAGAHPGFHPPPARLDSDVVGRLRAAGAILLGKTALHEWAFGVSTNNPHFGPTRNPHDPARIPGGSSGGSAAALAAGITVLALGTDTGGSIRIPAALCGVVGLKPTYGLVSLRGVTPLSRSLDHAGPMTNSVEDAFLLLEAISDFRRSAAPRPRILTPRHYFFDDVEPRIVALVREAASRLGTPTEIDAADAAGAWEANTTILCCEAAAFHEQRLREHPEWFGGVLAKRLGLGFEYNGVDYLRARDAQRAWRASLTHLLGEDAVLAVPATPISATLIGDREGADPRVLTRLTAPFNLAGVPVLSLPIGKVDGLPVGMQLVAGPGRESLLWEAAREIAPE